MIVVTIPAHNEEETVGRVVKGVDIALRGQRHKILVFCNNCTDNTMLEAARAGAEVVSVPEPGLANVFRAEMKTALKYSPGAVVHIDADGQYEVNDIPLLLKYLGGQYDMVMGDRLWKRPNGMTANKFICNKIGSLAYGLMLDCDIPDITTGFRVFTPEVVKIGAGIKAELTYTQELTWKVKKAGMRIMSVPVSFYPRKSGHSRLIKTTFNYIRRSFSDFRRFAL